MAIGCWIVFDEVSVDELVEGGCVISKSAIINKSLRLNSPVHISPQCQISSNTSIDKFTFLNWNAIVYQNVSIGSYCSIGRGVQIGLARHPVDWLSTHSFQYSSVWFPKIKEYVDLPRINKHLHHPETVVGSDVWIGNNALVLSGVRIGIGAIIGAGAVVTKDIPPYAVAVGSPAKIIKFRFSNSIIKQLLDSKWWLKNPSELSGFDFSDVEACLALLND